MADYSDYKECTDCVHYELCLHQEKFLIEHNRKDLIRRYGFGLSEPEICCNFRDRSRFVELPCKVGDSYFEIEQYCTERGFYNEPRQTDRMDCEYCDVGGVCDRQYRITEKRFNSLIQIFEYKEKAADRYNRKFLTKEEAEQALRECGVK